jgi:hypothetical protein
MIFIRTVNKDGQACYWTKAKWKYQVLNEEKLGKINARLIYLPLPV